MLVPVQLRPPVPYLHLLPIIDVHKAPLYGAFLCLMVYYYSRRVPLDMECHYGSKRIVKSQKPRSK
jgi:hypothetical protein